MSKKSMNFNTKQLKPAKPNFPFHKRKLSFGFSLKANQILPKPAKALSKKAASQKEKDQFSAVEVSVQSFRSKPQRFLNPIHTYDIFGFFFMYEKGFGNDQLVDDEKVGLFEVTNFYKKINKIERLVGDLTMIYCEDTNTPRVPFPLIISRLMSLSNKEAYILAQTIDQFCQIQSGILNNLEGKNEGSFKSEQCKVSLEEINEFRRKNQENFLLHDLMFDENNIQIGEKKEIEEFQERFADAEDFRLYEQFIQNINKCMSKNQDQSSYTVRYQAKPGADSYQTLQHFYSNLYGKLICPDETFHVSTLFREGFPNPIKCSSSYFKSADGYLSKLSREFAADNCNRVEFESEGKPDEKDGFVFETMDGLKMPVKIKISVDIFKGKRFIEIIKRTCFIVSEDNKRYLLSEERKRNFAMNYKNHRKEEQSCFEERKFINRFYPGVIPKNEISLNQSKICNFREIL